MRIQLVELSHFKFPKISMLENYTAAIKQFYSVDMSMTHNHQRKINNIKLAYSMSSNIKILRQILKYKDSRKWFKKQEVNCGVYPGDSMS